MRSSTADYVLKLKVKYREHTITMWFIREQPAASDTIAQIKEIHHPTQASWKVLYILSFSVLKPIHLNTCYYKYNINVSSPTIYNHNHNHNKQEADGSKTHNFCVEII